MLKKIVILASGGGSNAEQIIRYFENSKEVEVSAVISNKRNAGVFDRVQPFGIPCIWINKASFETAFLTDYLSVLKPDLIVLAGFLWKIPETLILNFPDKIINIHPALLPKFGGKGMYGNRIHQAVKEASEKHTGITIHLVNKDYDKGVIIFQKSIEILPNDSVEQISKKVLELEHRYFPKTIEQFLSK